MCVESYESRSMHVSGALTACRGSHLTPLSFLRLSSVRRPPARFDGSLRCSARRAHSSERVLIYAPAPSFVAKKKKKMGRDIFECASESGRGCENSRDGSCVRSCSLRNPRIPAATAMYCCVVFASDKSSGKTRRGRFPHLFSRASMFLIRPSDSTGLFT